MLEIIKIADTHYALFQEERFQATIGKNGSISGALKREGDQSTPQGTFNFCDLYYREDRLSEAEREIVQATSFVTHKITPQSGWSDDSLAPDYNQYVTLPYNHSHEKLWMEGSEYDVFLVVDYNLKHPVAGKGSAIFMHIRDETTAYTAGCITFARHDFFKLLQSLSPFTQITIGENT